MTEPRHENEPPFRVNPQGEPSAAPPRVLFVDDEPDVLAVCSRVAAALGYTCATARTGEEAAARLARERFDMVVTDVRMPGLDGYELADYIKRQAPGTAVAIMTAYGTIDQAVAALKAGVLDYVAKPFGVVQLANVLRELAEWRETQVHAAAGEAEATSFCGIVGRAPVMAEVFRRISRAASKDCTVLIQGETGTGKELVARAIHACSARSREPFLPVDCGALNENLAESELFGHVKGAFTGAHQANPGIFRSAGDGTVFLDEIGELPPLVQAKLLRALQEKESRPVGGGAPEPFHARIIAAANRDLERGVVEGTFRRDLFYRLHVLPIDVPPLRERREDIPLLAQTFAARVAGEDEATGNKLEVGPEAMKILCACEWPGNVRQLENTIEQAALLCVGPVITPNDLPAEIRAGGAEPWDASAPRGLASLESNEEVCIREALARLGYNKTRAAKALGISVPTLYRKIRKYNIVGDDMD